LLAGLAGAGPGGCALATDGEEPSERTASSTADRPPPAATDRPPPEATDRPPPEATDPDGGCTSTVTEFGLLCTTCPSDSADGESPPECLVADCNVIDGCLECTDPKGRVGTDCSIDYGDFFTASGSVGGGGSFAVCSAGWGLPHGTSGVCHYPGNDSCVIDEEARCIDCTYPDGSGTGVCVIDPETPLPDIMAGRPSGLPPPGECVDELGPDGALLCSTCTRDDLSATKMCRLPPAEWCEFAEGDDPIEKCMACALEDGGVAEICDDAGS
jgi:hypothetical protein